MIAKFVNHLKKAERGQSIIILAFAFVVLLGFVGLTTDVSLMFVRYATIRRAVDSASLAAATQMRQGTEEAAVAIAARQFVEFHGLDSVKVKVDTCQTVHPTDSDDETVALREELCTADQRKLVKVTAQIESPTVFLRLLGWENFTLQASAISETAALDVVLIMDVSESMLTETTYDDWAKIGMGFAYVPPNASNEIAPAKGVDKYALWSDLRNTAQSDINVRLWYDDTSGSGLHDAFDTGAYGAGKDDADYRVRVIDLADDSEYSVANGYPPDVTVVAPRESCRVRFSPTIQLEGPADKKGRAARTADGVSEPYIDLDTMYSENSEDYLYSKWDGFTPVYDYYACCNDPGVASGEYYDNGYAKLDLTATDPSAPDFDFTDLICQPFKGARDAVELFLEKIDFIRGDRVAFVTFDRSAFLVNPWDSKAQEQGYSHMIDRYDVALNTLRRVIGVRAEPNFYVWYDGGTDGRDSAAWTALAAGIDRVDGIAGSVPINYETNDGSGTYYHDTSIAFGGTDRINHNFPTYNNCFYADATVASQYSPTYNTLAQISHPYQLNIGQDDATTQTWGSYVVSDNFKGGGTTFNFSSSDLVWFAGRIGYEYYSECRGTNIGAALREGNNALLDPDTSRRFGAIWVMVLLSDGAAGASDPVRRNEEKLDSPNPYRSYTDTDGSTVYNPESGDYGAFGVCPYGIPSDPAELVDVVEEMNSTGGPLFPFCSDEDPASRHICDFRPDNDEEDAMWDEDYDENPLDDDGNLITDTQAIVDWNQARGNLYDLDIAPDGCSEYYDVDDYARDWADFIALRDEDSGVEELLPTIYTIGFGLTFDNEADPDVYSLAHIGDYLGEQMLRYIADAGDNNRIDNDYYQNFLDETNPGGLIAEYDEYGFRDPCQTEFDVAADGTYDFNGDGLLSQGEIDDMYGPRPVRENCGNYFNAPSADELEFVFDSIASKLFTRLTG